MSDPLQLSGVEIRRHDDETYPVVGDGFEPYAHQQDLRDLFANEPSFLAVNDSPTGGGKTLSWLAPVVEHGEHALAVYPTNALIEDQKKNVKQELSDTLEGGDNVDVLTITADSLRATYGDEYPNADTNGERLLALLRDRLRHSEQVLVLTNPDIFVMMRRDLYGRENDPGSRIRPLNEFRTVVVDEFHRAGRKEQNTLLFLLDEMYDLDERYCALSRIVLLSATPTERLERRFRDAMSAPYTRITDRRETAEERPFAKSPTEGWNPVMPPVDLDIRSASTFRTADELLDEDWEETREFAAREGKTVFILDGIHEVDRVYRRLDDVLGDRNVVRIDGFHRGDLDDKLREFDVLVSNSAVEVGIDFTVDRLVFSAHNQSSFLQRLGRLRTEPDVQEARCYVPSNVQAELGDCSSSTPISRASLVDTLSSAYHDPRDVESFDWRYSAAEAYYHVQQRAWNSNDEDAEAVKDEGWERIARHFGDAHDLSRSNVERRVDVIDRAIEETLQWYRGNSLQALVYDRTADPDERVKTYNLFYLLRYGDITFYPRKEFVETVVPDDDRTAAKHAASFVDAYCTYDGTIDAESEYGRNVTLEATTEALSWLKSGDGAQQKTRKPRILSELSVDVDVQDGSNRIGESLEHLRNELADDLGILCYAVDASPGKAKAQYKLGPFFFLYGLHVPGDGVKSAALGTDALYLHCADEDTGRGANLSQFGIDF